MSYGHRSKLFLNKFLFFYSYLSCQKSPWEGIPQKQQHQISLSFGPQSTFGNATIDQCTTSGRSSSRFHRQAHKICHSERLINVISLSFHSHLSSGLSARVCCYSLRNHIDISSLLVQTSSFVVLYTMFAVVVHMWGERETL